MSLARIYLDQGRPAAAEPLLRHALSSPAAAVWRPPGTGGSASTQSLLGAACTRLARFAEAEPYLLRAFELLRPTPGSDGPRPARPATNLARLVALYEAWGRPEKAAAYRTPR